MAGLTPAGIFLHGNPLGVLTKIRDGGDGKGETGRLCGDPACIVPIQKGAMGCVVTSWLGSESRTRRIPLGGKGNTLAPSMREQRGSDHGPCSCERRWARWHGRDGTGDEGGGASVYDGAGEHRRAAVWRWAKEGMRAADGVQVVQRRRLAMRESQTPSQRGSCKLVGGDDGEKEKIAQKRRKDGGIKIDGRRRYHCLSSGNSSLIRGAMAAFSRNEIRNGTKISERVVPRLTAVRKCSLSRYRTPRKAFEVPAVNLEKRGNSKTQSVVSEIYGVEDYYNE
ncbi:hypothetical protein B0H13DRAFT_1876197 [Mycena leptocephala]|nr:hypothetical protein B0H13DRAFT_1876197 [Mycena leptocephala]